MRKRFLALLVCACMLLIGIPHAGATITLLGDTDCDGRITAADASLILRALAGLSEIGEQGIENADANQNGRLDAGDAAAILRHLVRLTDLSVVTPRPSTTTTATPAPTAAPTATPVVTLDQTLLANVRKGCAKGSNDNHDWTEYAEDITRFIQALPTSNPYRAILYDGPRHMGKNYATMDCSTFVKTVYRDDCGYKNEYPSGSSDTVISWFLTNQKSRIHAVTFSGGTFSTSAWKPGYVLAYVDASGKGNHVSIYIGKVYGIDFVMESVTSRDGVVIRPVWSTDEWQLKYYINPLN